MNLLEISKLTRRMTHVVNVAEVPVKCKHILVATADLLVGALAGQLALVVSSSRLTLLLGERLLDSESSIRLLSLDLN